MLIGTHQCDLTISFKSTILNYYILICFFFFSSMSSMSTFSHGGLGTAMGPSPGACLQQRDSSGMGGAMSGYCMGRPPSYDLGIGYGSRPSPCSPSQPYQMNGHQYNTNGTSSTGIIIIIKNLQFGI